LTVSLAEWICARSLDRVLVLHGWCLAIRRRWPVARSSRPRRRVVEQSRTGACCLLLRAGIRGVAVRGPFRVSAVREGERVDRAHGWRLSLALGLAHYVREHSVKPPEEVLAHIRRRSEGGNRDWPAEYAGRVFWPEVGSCQRLEGEGEPERLEVDSVWWQKVTSA